MRYRVGQDAAEQAAHTGGTEATLLFTVILGLIFGFILLWLGIKGKQIWLSTWSVGLIVVSILTWVWMLE